MKSKFKEGDVLPIFLDYQNQEKFHGKAELLEYDSEALTFYDDNQKVKQGELRTMYGAERWKCKIVSSHYYAKGFVKYFWFRKKVTNSNDMKSISRHTTYGKKVSQDHVDDLSSDKPEDTD
jgi:hypothetical protein